jgi:hypothetical protein
MLEIFYIPRQTTDHSLWLGARDRTGLSWSQCENATRKFAMKGGCLCGAVRYETDATPMATVICHCTHCQRTSGSAFSVNVVLPREKLSVSGAPSQYQDRGDNGAPVVRFFCPTCGSSLMSVLGSGLIAVKAGTLDDASELTPSVQIWTRSARNWSASIPALPALETQA